MIMQTQTLEHRTFRLAAIAATALLALTGVTAMAQPVGAAGPWHGHGHAQGPGGGMGIEQVLASVKDQLNLDTSQQLNWTNAVTATKAAHVTERANMQAVHDALATELANPTPDLAKVAAVADGVHASNATLRQGVRNQWLAIYANLRPDQVTVVRNALSGQLARMDAMRARMQQRLQSGG
jgi:Spy/CpxP family protein refolding chaperone